VKVPPGNWFAPSVAIRAVVEVMKLLKLLMKRVSAEALSSTGWSVGKPRKWLEAFTEIVKGLALSVVDQISDQNHDRIRL